ncbi:MAG: symmetrical bis(5'-nucleosyl)-tetraphosphatase [Magnetococcales bacterium]|nr:symmetrical bis(5'-nucleosyl)-tetraphosphatase [Magnetococcales bacterium]
MAVYAIGDVHGCLPELQALLAQIDFRPQRDRLLFVGDILNRGPDSLGTVRFVRDLGEGAITLLGNHEARAIMGMSGLADGFFQSHLGALAQAPDAARILSWLRALPLMHREASLGVTMVHAGLYPDWTMADAFAFAARLSAVLRDDAGLTRLLAGFREPFPEQEPDDPDEMARLRFALAVMTRIRYCTPEGRLVWANPAGLAESPPDWTPWYGMRPLPEPEVMVYGHWAAAGLTIGGGYYGLDSGCVYGGKLTALRLDHPERPRFQVPCPCYVKPEIG